MDYRGVAVIQKDDTEEDILTKIDEAIGELTSLGYRDVPSKGIVYAMMWSNAYSRWYAPRRQIREPRVDANYVVIVNRGKKGLAKILRKLADEYAFRTLPLFDNSFEARTRAVAAPVEVPGPGLKPWELTSGETTRAKKRFDAYTAGVSSFEGRALTDDDEEIVIKFGEDDSDEED